jgi:O-antigen ligase
MGYMTNPNIFGSYTGFSLFFIGLGLLSNQSHINKMFYGIIGIICIIYVYYSGCRAILIGLSCALLTYLQWNYIIHNKRRFQLYFILVIVLIFGMTIFYLYIQLLPFRDTLDSLSKEFVGKTIYSPRQMIWLAILQKLTLKPILGYGPYYIPKNLLDTGYSAHNVYLQVALQSGCLGLLSLVALLGSIWASFWPGRHDARVRLAGAFLIAIVVHQTFDVSLTQHQPAQALLMWLILGVGTGISLHYAHQTSTGALSTASAGCGSPAEQAAGSGQCSGAVSQPAGPPGQESEPCG